MNNWLEDIQECLIDGKVILKVSFGIITNYSFIKHIAHTSLENNQTFTFDGNYETKLENSLNGLFINSNLEILEIELDEHPTQQGYYKVDIVCNYTLPENFKEQNGYNDNSKLSHIAEDVKEFFILISTLNNKVSVLVPASLNLRIKSENEWKRVVQIGGGQPHMFPCNPESFSNIIKNLPSFYDKVKSTLETKKTKKLISIYSSALRFQNNHFYSDAFLNFYKVIELIYKDTSFSSKYIELLKKPSLYGNAMRQSSQKVQMLFIWEYLNKLSEDNDDKLLKDLLELADIRNKLAHESGELLEVSKVAIAHAISNFMLQHFILNT